MGKAKKLTVNMVLLYILTFFKLVFPLILLPYLTQTLTKDCYGVVTYVKACLSYFQLIIDFGFIYSATKDIVYAAGDKKKQGEIIGNTLALKMILSFLSCVVMLVMCSLIDILKQNLMFVFLYFISVVISAFLCDFYFRGIERMEMITIPFVISKIISVTLTILFVKSDKDILFLPTFEIMSMSVSVLFVMFYLRKQKIKIGFSRVSTWIHKIKDSFIYFLSDAASTTLGALNTVIIGIVLTKSEVAEWGVCIQLVSAVQAMYMPVGNSLYPYMIKYKSKKMLNRIMLIFMPIIVFGCVICLLYGGNILYIIGGAKYEAASELFKIMVPLLLISFPVMMYGWPALGAVCKARETTRSTVIAALIQVSGIALMFCFNSFNLVNFALCRIASEFSLLLIRYFYYRKYIDCFSE